MTHATLSKQLKQLEAYGLIERREYAQVPPKVEYTLSNIGKEFIPTLQAFHKFGEKYIDYMHQELLSKKHLLLKRDVCVAITMIAAYISFY